MKKPLIYISIGLILGLLFIKFIVLILFAFGIAGLLCILGYLLNKNLK